MSRRTGTWSEERKQYRRNHYRVKRIRGRAGSLQCVLCFSAARDWAYLWRTHPDAADPYSYAPMCRRDHIGYDLDKARLSEQARRTFRDPEFLARQSERLRRQWQDPAYRAKMAAHARERWADPEFRELMESKWDDPEWLAGRSEATRRLWDDPEYRARMLPVLRANNERRQK